MASSLLDMEMWQSLRHNTLMYQPNSSLSLCETFIHCLLQKIVRRMITDFADKNVKDISVFRRVLGSIPFDDDIQDNIDDFIDALGDLTELLEDLKENFVLLVRTPTPNFPSRISHCASTS
jgi:hypothetical protein